MKHFGGKLAVASQHTAFNTEGIREYSSGLALAFDHAGKKRRIAWPS
jgi:hypothetical protein